MSQSITGSVGAPPSSNLRDDVKTVQTLLNKVPANKGGPVTRIRDDGICDPLTIAAISRFQQTAVGMKSPDGRVDPGKATINKLNEYDNSGVSPGTGTTPGVLNDLQDIFKDNLPGAKDFPGLPEIKDNIPGAKDFPGLPNIGDTLDAKDIPSPMDIIKVVIPIVQDPPQPQPLTIGQSVGFNTRSKKPCANQFVDVRTVKTLLNKVPFENGGTGGTSGQRLDEDNYLCDDKMIAAIIRFQKTALATGLDDGEVGANGMTLRALNLYHCHYSATPFADLRKEIKRIALSYIGKVKSEGPLEGYYKNICTSLCNPKEPNQAKCVSQGPPPPPRYGHEILRTFYNVCISEEEFNKSADYRHKLMCSAQHARLGGWNWCGIFAAHVLNAVRGEFYRGSKNVTWARDGTGLGRRPNPSKPNEGQHNKGLLEMPADRSPQPGDVIILTGDRIHHCIMIERIKDGFGDYLVTVNGNSDGQGILIKMQPVTDMGDYYRVVT